MDDEQPRLAILGAGPIGLEAALYGRYLGYPAVILEREREPARSVLSHGDEVLGAFTELASPLGVAALKAQNPEWQPPRASEILTGAQWRERYLLLLAESDLLGDLLHLNAEVTAIDRRDEDEDVSFQIRCRDATHEADIIIDATGVEGSRAWFSAELSDDDLGFLNPNADYYIIGMKSRTNEPFHVTQGLNQIRDLFAILGEREDLDVYATFPEFA